MTKVYTKEDEREMDRAVNWLRERGGSGVQVKYGQVLAGGDTSKQIGSLAWLRCLFTGRLVMDRSTGRIFTPEAFETMRGGRAA